MAELPDHPPGSRPRDRSRAGSSIGSCPVLFLSQNIHQVEGRLEVGKFVIVRFHRLTKQLGKDRRAVSWIPRPVGEVRWRPSAVQSGRCPLRRRAAGRSRFEVVVQTLPAYAGGGGRPRNSGTTGSAARNIAVIFATYQPRSTSCKRRQGTWVRPDVDRHVAAGIWVRA